MENLLKKISVGILGATGIVGQKFVQMLSAHPWFQITALAASDRSAGKTYGEAMTWSMSTKLPEKIAKMPVLPCHTNLPCRFVFSGLDSAVAGEIEKDFAKAGYYVISNCSHHRMSPNVPLVIPEVNSDHLKLLEAQSFGQGGIVTNPNCSVIGMVMALKPLLKNWGIEAVNIVTFQALSGAGYPGVPSMDILDNVIPYISGEEIKLETEPLKIMGALNKHLIIPHPMQVSAQCTRVPVSDGHLACLSVKLKKSASRKDLITSWQTFKGDPQRLSLPTAPKHPIIYLEDERHPQPKLHRHLGEGMTLSIGRLRECPLLDWKFVILSHNTVRGAAGSAILNAELMAKNGYFCSPELLPTA